MPKKNQRTGNTEKTADNDELDYLRPAGRVQGPDDEDLPFLRSGPRGGVIRRKVFVQMLTRQSGQTRITKSCGR